MYSRNHANEGNKHPQYEKQYACRQEIIHPERADQKNGKYMPAGEGLSRSISWYKRNDVEYLIRPGAVDKFADPAHG